MAFRFIAGSDDFLVQLRAQAEWEQLAKGVGDPHALEIIDGQCGTVDEVARAVTQFIGAVQTVSLFAPEKAVWLRGITFMADTVTGRAQGTEAEIERLQAVLADFDADAVKVLLSAAPVDRRKRAYKWFQSKGDSLFIESKKDDSTLPDLLAAEAEAAGCRFAPGAVAVLTGLTGVNPRLALEETRKLVTWLGPEGGTITPERVAELVPSVGESDFFEAAEAFYSLQLDRTLEAIRRHFFAGHDARPLISSLQNRNRILLQLKAMQAGGVLGARVTQAALDKAAATELPQYGDSPEKNSFCVFTQNIWYLGRLSECLPRLTLKVLLEFQDAFREAFLEIHERPNEQEAVLAAMAVRCLSPLQARS